MDTKCGPTDEQGVVYVTQWRGDTFRLVAEFSDAAQQPVDVSSFEWLAQLRDNVDAVVAEIVIDETDASIGVIVLTMTGDVTAALAPADYVFDVEGTDEEDVTRTLINGQLRLKTDVSREAVG